MPTSQEGANLDRRAIGRTMINRDVLMYFLGQGLVQACRVRDVTNHGAGTHVVRRDSRDGGLLIKVGADEMRPCNEAEVRTLLPVQAYSQKQLSDVSLDRESSRGPRRRGGGTGRIATRRIKIAQRKARR